MQLDENILLNAFLDTAYVRSLADTQAASTVRFTGAPEESWNVRSTSHGKDGLRLNAGFTGRMGDRFTLELSYGLDVRDQYTDQSANLGIGFTF